MSRKSVKQKIRDNELKKCNAKGCQKHRHGFSGYCTYHNRKKYEFGWVDGRRIFPKEYEHDMERVRGLIESNPEHPGIKVGIAYFENWINGALNGRRVLGVPHFQRLGEEGITGKDLLIECAGLWVYSWENPRTLPDAVPLTYALSICVLTKSNNARGCKTSIKLTANLRRTVGQLIRDNLGVLFMNMHKALDKQEQRIQERRQAMAEPLIV